MLETEVQYEIWSCPGTVPLNIQEDGQPRILLAEDNAIDQVSIRRLLERDGIDVRCVESGRDALNAAREQRYNLILMDILMPEMDGFEAASRIRDEEQHRSDGAVPILALTSYSLKAIQDKCRAVGMNGYLSKPVSRRSLRAVCTLLRIVPEQQAAPQQPAAEMVLPVLDQEDALVNLGGVWPLYAELLDLFMQQAPELIEGIIQKTRTGALDRTGPPVYRLLGLADNIGARRLAYICRHLLSSIDIDNRNDCDEWAGQLSHELKLLEGAIHGIHAGD
jgi:CheY-like chemotaxis protein